MAKLYIRKKDVTKSADGVKSGEKFTARRTIGGSKHKYVEHRDARKESDRPKMMDGYGNKKTVTVKVRRRSGEVVTKIKGDSGKKRKVVGTEPVGFPKQKGEPKPPQKARFSE